MNDHTVILDLGFHDPFPSLLLLSGMARPKKISLPGPFVQYFVYTSKNLVFPIYPAFGGRTASLYSGSRALVIQAISGLTSHLGMPGLCVIVASEASV
jgi:hypothetical protein